MEAPTTTLQTVPFRIKLSDLSRQEKRHYWIQAHTREIKTTVLVRLYKVEGRPSIQDCLRVEIWNCNNSASVKAIAEHSITPRTGTTVVSIHPSVCADAQLLDYYSRQETTIPFLCLDGEIPIQAVAQGSFGCGHFILSVRSEFDVVDLSKCYGFNFDDTHITATLEETICQYEIKTLASVDCPVCSFVGDLPEPPKNAPATFMELFDNDPFTRDDFADFNIRVLDSEYWIHPVVVGKASPVLRGMITNKDTQEARQGYTTAHNADPQDVRLLLDAIYNGSCMDGWERTFDFLSPIYALADFYGVSKVMAACKAAFRFVPVDASNICEILAFADLYGIWELVRRSTPTAALEVALNLLPLNLAAQVEALTSYRRLKRMELWSDGWGHRNIGDLVSIFPVLAMPEDWCPKTVLLDRKFIVEIRERTLAIDFHDRVIQNLCPRSVTCYTDGSRTDWNDRSGAGFFVDEFDLKESIPLGNYATVFQSEVCAIRYCASSLVSAGCQGKIDRFFSDSQAALKAIRKIDVLCTSVRDCIEDLNELARNNIVNPGRHSAGHAISCAEHA